MSPTGGRGRSARSGFSAEEKAAAREAVHERRRRPPASAADAEREVLAKIAAMAPSDRRLAERIHAIVRTNAPDLVPRTWYGMPAYAKDGHVVCFFQDARKFKTRYATLGFSDEAHLDAGEMWPVGFAVTELSPALEAKVAALVRKAVG